MGALVGVIVIATSLYGILEYRAVSVENFHTRAQRMTDRLAQSCGSPLWNVDTQSIERIVDALMADPEVYSVEVFERGKEVIRKNKNTVIKPITKESRIAYMHDGSEFAVTGKARVTLTGQYVYKDLFRACFLSLVTALIVFGVILLGIVFLLDRIVQKPIESLLSMALRISKGDFTTKHSFSSIDELGELERSFTAMADTLRRMLVELKVVAREIAQEAKEVFDISKIQTEMAHRQAAAVTETSEIINEIARISKEASEQADSVISMAKRSEDVTKDGQKRVEESKESISSISVQVSEIGAEISALSERSHQIGGIMITVKDLADQSNLLALNASIEAAKAGERAQGFVIVAEEMRILAGQIKNAASGVRTILAEILDGTRATALATDEGKGRVDSALALAEFAGESIGRLAQAIQDNSMAARMIANNTRQQTVGISQVATAITELSDSNSKAVESTMRVAEAVATLNAISDRISQVVSRYNV